MPSAAPPRILLTGATGTLGRNVVHTIAAHPSTRLHLLLRHPDPTLVAAFSNVTQQQLDLVETPALIAAVRDFCPSVIVHCAASGLQQPAIQQPGPPDFFTHANLNVNATLALFQAACHLPHCHFLHVSTGLVYSPQQRPCREDDPIGTLHPYGATKAAADLLLLSAARSLARPLTIVRPFSFTGLDDRGSRLFPSLLRAAASGQPFPMSPATQIRDFCAVQDIAEAIVLLLANPAPDQPAVYNLGSGQSIPLGHLVALVCDQLHIEVQLQPGARPCHPWEPMHLVADISRARSLGWQPSTSLAYAVWQLARSHFPTLRVAEPPQHA